MPIESQLLNFNGIEIVGGSLASNSITDNSIIVLEKVTKAKRMLCIEDISAATAPEEYLRLVKEHPHLLSQYKSNDLEFATVLESNDVASVRSFLMKRQLNNHKRAYDQQQELNRIDQDPTNEENQKKIEEMIRLENIQVFCFKYHLQLV